MTNKIILGTVQFGMEYGVNNLSGKPSFEVAASILDLAFANNIRLLDTAEAYGNAQDVIGAYHKGSQNRFGVITKFSAARKDLSEDLSERVLQNLKVLNVDNLYAYMFHSFADLELYYPTYKEQISQLKERKLIRKFGVSIYTNAEFESVLKYDEIDLVQLPFNLLDNNFQRGQMIAAAKEKGIEIHTRSVFLQGLFFKDPQVLPSKLLALQPYLEEIREQAAVAGATVQDLALTYAVGQKNIDYVLVGIDIPDQLLANMKSLQRKMPADTGLKIDALRVHETDLLNPANWNK